MDERLEAGRHHLVNGSRALDQGYPDDARAHYRAALLQFRGPELRLGEAHALRGLARVDLVQGRPADAGDLARRAVDAYEALLADLDAVDPDGLGAEVRLGAQEGQAAAWVLVADASLRCGRLDQVEPALERAQAVATTARYAPVLADLQVTRGHLALRRAHVDEAAAAWRDAAARYGECGIAAGEATAWLLRAELERWRGRPGDARAALDQAAAIATILGSDRLLGRIAYGRALLALADGDLGGAAVGFQTALPLLRRAGDHEMVGYAWLGQGGVASRSGNEGARAALSEALSRLGAVGSRHGLGAVALQISDQALRAGHPEVALVAADVARRLWRETDPVRGHGQALRGVARALAALGRNRDALLAATLRQAVALEDQPTAESIARWLGQRVVGADARLADRSPRGLSATLDQVLDRAISPFLGRSNLEPDVLYETDGARLVLGMLNEQLPTVAKPAPAPSARPAIPEGFPDDAEQPTGTFAVLGADRAGRAGTPSPAPPRRAYHSPSRSEEDSK